MIVTINGKAINLSQEEYEALFSSIIDDSTYNNCNSCCPPVPPAPVNKMDELIEAINNIKDAIISKENVKYHLEKEGENIKLVGTDGTTSSVVDQDFNTTYFISNDKNVVQMRGSDNSVQTIILPEDTNTNYDISFNPDNDKLTLTSSDGEESSSEADLSKFADDEDIGRVDNESIDDLFPDNH
ncbi:MAG: hypothetical protein IJ880_10790 [Bacilli bacterium]|nr:hypothetical protein [Bacilli bacterium]